MAAPTYRALMKFLKIGFCLNKDNNKDNKLQISDKLDQHKTSFDPFYLLPGLVSCPNL